AGKDNIDAESLNRVVFEIKSALENNSVELAVVIGAGNIWRGGGKSIDRVNADKIGMLATLMNALSLKDAFKKAAIENEVFAPNNFSVFAENFDSDRVVKSLTEGKIVIFAGGTGSPFFTTDTGAALRALEIKADLILKATQIDGVYSADPKKDAKAVKYGHLTFDEAIEKNLQIMDAEAFAMCRRGNIPIRVFNFYEKLNLKKVLGGENIGTLISN
ncbi:MAG: UMP kinase, partial [Elusimicrobiota bacterium]|nr:UMP kinase [Elusimicrobiota bacterium]